MANWCTIESDPGVFTELISSIGAQGVQVEELYGMDPEFLDALKPVYGLIFLFKWDQNALSDDRSVDPNPDPKLFFAKQTVQNACATQALLSILMNAPKDVEIGETLSNFKSFLDDFSPDLRGEAIGDHDVIRTAHNSFARPEPFISDGKAPATKDDEVYHFIAYIPFNGALYELDGLKPGPIKLGIISEGEDWTRAIVPHIEARIARYSSSEIHFSLLAMVKDQRLVAEEAIESITEKIAIHVSEGNSEEQAREEANLESAKEKLREVNEKFLAWKEENIRRKHNYIPFVVALLKACAKKGKLQGLVKDAQKRVQEKAAAAAAKKQASSN